DARKRRERLPAESVGNAAHDCRRAIDRGQEPDVVARRDAPVSPDDAHERRGRIDVARRLHVHAERVVASERAHLQVVEMDVLAGADVPRREPDDLVVALDGLAGGNRARGDLVSRWNQPGDGDVLLRQQRAAHKLRAGDHDVIVGVKADGQRGAGKHEFLLDQAGSAARATARLSIAGKSQSMPSPGVEGATAKPSAIASREVVMSSSWGMYSTHAAFGAAAVSDTCSSVRKCRHTATLKVSARWATLSQGVMPPMRAQSTWTMEHARPARYSRKCAG